MFSFGGGGGKAPQLNTVVDKAGVPAQTRGTFCARSTGHTHGERSPLVDTHAAGAPTGSCPGTDAGTREVLGPGARMPASSRGGGAGPQSAMVTLVWTPARAPAGPGQDQALALRVCCCCCSDRRPRGRRRRSPACQEEKSTSQEKRRVRRSPGNVSALMDWSIIAVFWF